MATVLSDWVIIAGFTGVNGPPANQSGRFSLNPFNTSERRGHGQTALLIYTVSRVQRPVHVEINNIRVGTITRAIDPSADKMQLMVFNEDKLLDTGNNTITITDISKGFEIRDMTCFYHRTASSPGIFSGTSTVLADFTMIVGDSPVQVPITQGTARVTLPEPGTQFDTGGRLKFAEAILIFSIRLLGIGESASVFVNNTQVGTIQGSQGSAPHLVPGLAGEQPGEFRTQFITFAGKMLKADQGNTLSLGNVSHAFEIKDVVCFFHQAT
jgi:hypothetical protein